MLNSKAIDVLKTFSSEEMKHFAEFLHSPFHNKNKKVIALFETLRQYHGNYDDKRLTKEMLFEKIFSSGSNKMKFNDASIRNLLSDLLILEEKFLSYISFEKDKFDFYEKCLREMTDRNLSAVFDKKIKAAEEILGSNLFPGEDRFYKKYLLEELKSFSSQFSDDLKLFKNNSMSKAFEYLSYFYLIRIFKIMNFFEFQKQYNIEHKNLFGMKLIDKLDLPDVSESKEKESENDMVIFRIYYAMYNAMKDHMSDEHYFAFKKLLTEKDNLFAPLEKYGLYVCLTNCCVQKIDSGKDEFFKECFDVYKVMFEKNLFLACPGYLPMGAYSAVVNTGISAGEYEWIEKFIEEYSVKLNPEHREDAELYSLAQLNFARKNYPAALENISKTNTEFSNFKFHLKMLQMKIYYETGDFDSLEYAVDSFKHFLSKNKMVGENYKQEFTRFVQILRMLMKYSFNKDKSMEDDINIKISSNAIAGKSWLKRKFAELSKQR